MNNPDFSILITTKNRRLDLEETLNQLSHFINNDNVEFIICDDGSSDGTSNFIESSSILYFTSKNSLKEKPYKLYKVTLLLKSLFAFKSEVALLLVKITFISKRSYIVFK